MSYIAMTDLVKCVIFWKNALVIPISFFLNIYKNCWGWAHQNYWIHVTLSVCGIFIIPFSHTWEISHFLAFAFLTLHFLAFHGIIITPIIISSLTPQLALEWASVNKGEKGDLPHLLSFLQDSIPSMSSLLLDCYYRSCVKSSSDGIAKSVQQDKIPTASALIVSEQDDSHSVTYSQCFNRKWTGCLQLWCLL